MLKPSNLTGKRVLFVLCGFELGGAERQALHFARHLKSRGVEVTVWGHHHRHVGPERVIAMCEDAGIPWAERKFRWPCGKLALLRDSWRLWWGLCREHPDAILAYTTWPNVGCGLVWRWSPARVFIWGQRNCEDLRGDALERMAYRTASAVICNAGHEVDYLDAVIGRTSAPIHVVHNGTDLPPPQMTAAAWRANLGIPAEAMVFTMLANFRHGQKDHPTLLHAWAQVLAAQPPGSQKPHLVLAGAPQDSHEAVLTLAGELNILDSLHAPGHVTDVAGLLAASDVGVLATTYEGLPNAVLEYMMAGLPVVASDVPGVREGLGPDSAAPLCPPGDVAALAAALLALVGDPARRRALGARNREHAATRFSLEAMCGAMTGILEDALRETAGSET